MIVSKKVVVITLDSVIDVFQWELARFDEGFSDMKWMDSKSSSGKAFGKGRGRNARKGQSVKANIELGMDEMDDFSEEGLEESKQLVADRQRGVHRW